MARDLKSLGDLEARQTAGGLAVVRRAARGASVPLRFDDPTVVKGARGGAFHDPPVVKGARGARID